MKKKLLSLVLVLVLLPTIFMFSACGSDAYNLKNLTSDYNKIYENLNTISIKDNKIKFDYSDYSLFNNQVITNAGSFAYVNNYNTMLVNMMTFSEAYLNTVSSGGYKVSDKVKNRLKNELDNLSSSLKKLDVNAQGCGDYLQLTGEPNLALGKLENLFYAYDEAYESAFNFNSTLIEIYFSNTKLYDYSSSSEFQPLRAIIDMKFDARLKQQIVFTTQAFVEIHIGYADFYKATAKSSIDFGGKLDVYNSYLSTVASLNKQVEEQNVESVVINDSKKAEFKEYAVKVNNILAVMNNELDYFVTACNKINYVKSSLDKNATPEEVTYIKHIDNFNYINGQLNFALNGMLTVLGV